MGPRRPGRAMAAAQGQAAQSQGGGQGVSGGARNTLQ